MNEVLKAIRERRSIRKYRPEPVKEEDLLAILDAGTWAASGMGAQSAKMVVVKDEDTVKKLRKLNAEILGQPDADPFYGAPTIVVVLADGTKYNWLQDGSLVMGNLMLAAHALGVGSCWINRVRETFDRPEGKELLAKWGLADTYQGVAICILGYPDGPAPKAKPRKENYILRV